MEDDASSSLLSNGKTNIVTFQISDSFDSNYPPFCASKRPRLEHNNNNNNAPKFKGVVQQQNGHWGAQIYANHQRIWLGTFKSEKEAAMAYDSAAIKLRSGDSCRNFPWNERNIQEPNFQIQFSAQVILNMIRDGSYQPNFADFLKTQSRRQGLAGTSSLENNSIQTYGDGQFSCIQLFQKELTPSDVGKLNRLVIPKKFAIKYFPYISGNVEEDAGIEDLELVFFDRLMKCWKFRYCYWKSSQSYVFTRGWNRFVKEKNLKEKDIVTFYACIGPNTVQEGQHFSLIDISYSNGQSCVADDGVSHIEEMQKDLELNLGQTIRNKFHKHEEKGENGFRELELKISSKSKGLRLFGVQIN
ncbi:hypothetical protein JCGZ_24432 [Jatropha curcas]|uniref:AP2/ERF and B3 domain-containing transcription factor n=1 Tax=Jatropha curcas TaxID=180498 RepID=A0A067JPZ4_JATCU|nr:AP2/ERF and B3 domain-containing transcription factor At1g50680 [Jatropha curcas]KDP24888.1 hypothetical protein JCGZ_24432 [Jatropha curcas]